MSALLPGAAFLFTGWNGFNSGSALQAGFLAVQASTNTVIGASSAAFVWAIISVIKFRKRVDPRKNHFRKVSSSPLFFFQTKKSTF